jgi:hypothetical protein
VITARQDGIAKLYHYQGNRLDYLEDTLKNGRVHLSNPQSFNDPWDCRPCFDARCIADPVSRGKWRSFLEARLKELQPEQEQVLIERLGPDWHNNDAFMVMTINKMTSSVEEINAERWRIYCLTRRPDSLLMWAHYGDKHTGICLEFDAAIEPFVRAYRVLYNDTLVVLGPDCIEDARKVADAVLLSKSKEWKYEGEYRLLGRDHSIDPAFSIPTEGGFLRLPEVALTGIIVGCSADLKEILSIVQTHAPRLPVWRAVRMRDRYHLEIVENGV